MIRLRRHSLEKKRLRNVLLVGSSDREDFLDYLDINCVDNLDKARNYRWKNRNLMNVPTNVVPRPEVTYKTDIIVYFVNLTEKNNLSLLKYYFDTHIHVKHHIIVYSDFDEDYGRLKKSDFYKDVNKYTDMMMIDSDYEDLETFIKKLTKKTY